MTKSVVAQHEERYSSLVHHYSLSNKQWTTWTASQWDYKQYSDLKQYNRYRNEQKITGRRQNKQNLFQSRRIIIKRSDQRTATQATKSINELANNYIAEQKMYRCE